MGDETYKMIGMVTIPEDQKAKFNDHVLQILYLCGMRKIETVEVYGKKFSVVTIPKPDNDGVVRYDYSIFEKKKRLISTYDTLRCELVSIDRGYNEFGLTMNMIMVLQEAYSVTPCYLIYKDEPCRIEGYAAVIKSLLGINLKFPNRGKIWDMLLVLRNSLHKAISIKELLDAFPYAFDELDKWQMLAVFRTEQSHFNDPYTSYEMEDNKELSPEISVEFNVYQIMNKIVKKGENEKLHAFLRDLLDRDLDGRKQLICSGGDYSLLAKASLCLMLPFMVSAYASALKKSFWETWDSLDIIGYRDITQVLYKTKKSSKEGYRYPFYRAILRSDENEFIEYWSENGTIFSEKIEECFTQWRKRIAEMKWDPNICFEKLMRDILEDISAEKKYRLPDRTFITEFMEHQNEEIYGRALLLYKEILDKDTEYFPELTRNQAKRWIINDMCNPFNFTMIDAYHALLINHKHRYEILGF